MTGVTLSLICASWPKESWLTKEGFNAELKGDLGTRYSDQHRIAAIIEDRFPHVNARSAAN